MKTCATCQFYSSDTKQCRFNPPVLVDQLFGILTFMGSADPVTKFPETEPNDWCGQHQPRVES